MKYDRTYNFSAGPAMMPEPVLEEIAAVHEEKLKVAGHRIDDLEKKTGHERPKDRNKRMRYKEREKQLKQKDEQDKSVERRDK